MSSKMALFHKIFCFVSAWIALVLSLECYVDHENTSDAQKRHRSTDATGATAGLLDCKPPSNYVAGFGNKVYCIATFIFHNESPSQQWKPMEQYPSLRSCRFMSAIASSAFEPDAHKCYWQPLLHNSHGAIISLCDRDRCNHGDFQSQCGKKGIDYFTEPQSSAVHCYGAAKCPDNYPNQTSVCVLLVGYNFGTSTPKVVFQGCKSSYTNAIASCMTTVEKDKVLVRYQCSNDRCNSLTNLTRNCNEKE